MQINIEKIMETTKRNVGMYAKELMEIMAAEGGTFYSTLNSCLVTGILTKYKEIKMIEELADATHTDGHAQEAEE